MEFDEVLELCGDRRRRIVLATLEEHRQSLTIDDLAAAIAEHDQHEPPEVSGETLAQITTALHHSHVPKLADAGLVRYDHERELVEPTEQFDRAEPHLSAILDADPEGETALES